MWEYNQTCGNARSGILMHKDHKYIDKYRDAKGNWQYVYNAAKSGASRAASVAKKGVNAVTNKAAGVAQLIKGTNANGNENVPKTVDKKQQAKKENEHAHQKINESFWAMQNYFDIYGMVNNASDFPVNYKDPTDGHIVTISNERAKGMALKQISGNMDSLYQTINKTLSGMNTDDPAVADLAEYTNWYYTQAKEKLPKTKLSAKPTRRERV